MFVIENILEKFLIKDSLNLSLDELFVAYIFYNFNNDIIKYKVEGAVKQEAYKMYKHLVKKYKSNIEKLNSDGDILIEPSIENSVIPLPPLSIEKLVKCNLFEYITGSTYKINVNEFKRLFIDKYDALKELLDLFRNVYLQINNTKIPVVTLTHYDTLSDRYAKSINNSTVTHTKVISICKNAIEKNLVNTGIEKIIESRMWLVWDENKSEEEPIIKINRF